MNNMVLQNAVAPGLYVSGLIGDRFQILETQFVSGSYFVFDTTKDDNVRDKNGAIQYFDSLEEAELFCGLKFGVWSAKAAKTKAAKAPKAAKPAKAPKEVKEKAPKAAKAPKEVKAKGVTKAEMALELLKQNPGISNADLMQMFMDQLQMTKLGARTYVYNVRKLVA